MNDVMKKPTKRELEQAAEQLGVAIRSCGDAYLNVGVQVHRGCLQICADGEYPVARLSPLGAEQFGLSYCTRQGQWEKMPFAGPLDQMASTIIESLGPYLQAYHFLPPMRESRH